MTADALAYAISEAERFLRAARKARASIVMKSYGEEFANNTVTAAAKRASMDLTRALSAMRKP
jgi:hypothetical protein